MFFIDLDNFKQVNDTLGHYQGDRVLRRVAEVFRETLGDAGVIGRVGGDEFVAFLGGIGTPGEAARWAGRLCGSVSGIGDLSVGELNISCSIGGAVSPEDGEDYNTLFVKADMAVYDAKARGKNRYAFYSQDLKTDRHQGSV